MSKFVITGGTGFVGANVVRALVARGDDVHLIVRPTSDHWRLKNISSKIKTHPINLLRVDEVRKVLEEINPDVAIHLSAEGANSRISLSEKEIVDGNLVGTIIFANACLGAGVKAFINTGSSSEYGFKDYPIVEEDILEPINLYGVTKAAATLYCSSLNKKADISVVTLRLFSPYGYFEGGHRLVPAVIHAALNGEEFKAFTSRAVRDFIFIGDVVDAYLKAIDNIANIKGQIFNIASGVEHSMAHVIKTVESLTGQKINVLHDDALLSRQEEPQKWVGDVSKAKRMLGWQPKTSLEEGLGLTIEWFRNQELYEKHSKK